MSTENLLQWGGQVIKNPFSDEDIKLLCHNPNVASITQTNITFTAEFSGKCARIPHTVTQNKDG